MTGGGGDTHEILLLDVGSTAFFCVVLRLAVVSLVRVPTYCTYITHSKAPTAGSFLSATEVGRTLTPTKLPPLCDVQQSHPTISRRSSSLFACLLFICRGQAD
eukprot:scaffold34821_cov206-Amphora_coffeaeformis.AAC.2